MLSEEELLKHKQDIYDTACRLIEEKKEALTLDMVPLVMQQAKNEAGSTIWPHLRSEDLDTETRSIISAIIAVANNTYGYDEVSAYLRLARRAIENGDKKAAVINLREDIKEKEKLSHEEAHKIAEERCNRIFSVIEQRRKEKPGRPLKIAMM